MSDATLQMHLLLRRSRRHRRRFYLADGDISFREISTATINPFSTQKIVS